MSRKSLRLFGFGVLAIAGFAVALGATARPFARAAPARTPPPQGTPTNSGQTTVLGMADNGNANLLFGQPIQVAGTGTLASISFYVTTAAGTFRVGLYDSTGSNGGPGTLLAQSGDVTAATGWNTVAMPQAPVTSGTYWLYVLPSSNTLAFVKTVVSGDSNPYASFSYGAMPRTFPATSTTTSSEWSLYATVSITGGGGTTPTTTTTTPTTTTTTTTTTPPGPQFPLKVSSNGRYLVDQNDVPFLMVGDSPQSTIGMMSESEADRYFADRQAHGFNTVWINLLCDDYTFCASDGRTWDGIAPFTTGSSPSGYDLSTPNPAYFQRVDDIVHLAAAHGLLVVLDPIETGGWLDTLRANGVTKDFNYGAYLGSRYKSFPNIVWMSGNDFQSWGTSSDDAVVRAVAQGIQSTDPNHLQTSELNFTASSSLDDSNWSSILGMNAAYTYYPTYAEVLHAYNQTPTMPAFMVEANYEFEHNPGTDGGSTQNLRRQEYWTMLSGATGQLYGSAYTDRIANGWSPANLDSVGVTQLGYMTALFQGRPWYNLVPDQSHTLVTAGSGTFSSNGSIATNDYATAARTADGSLAMVYMPTARTVTVDMAQLGSNVTAQWYDPTNGSYATVNGSPFANTGSRQFTPPTTNSGGDSDWVLVLTAGGGLPPPPPTLTIGEANVLPTPDDGNGNLLVAQSAILSQAATVTSLSFYVTSAAGKLRLGIYDSSGPGGGPGTLMAQTAEITPVTGWNTANVTSPVSLPAGTYWLAYFPSATNLAFVKTSDASSSGEFYSLPYGALPATFSTAPNATRSHWSFYATLTTDSGTNQPAH